MLGYLATLSRDSQGQPGGEVDSGLEGAHQLHKTVAVESGARHGGVRMPG